MSSLRVGTTVAVASKLRTEHCEKRPQQRPARTPHQQEEQQQQQQEEEGKGPRGEHAMPRPRTVHDLRALFGGGTVVDAGATSHGSRENGPRAGDSALTGVRPGGGAGAPAEGDPRREPADSSAETTPPSRRNAPRASSGGSMSGGGGGRLVGGGPRAQDGGGNGDEEDEGEERRGAGAGSNESSPARSTLTDSSEDQKLALLLVNGRNHVSEAFLRQLWARADLRVCADGAANTLFDRFAGREEAAAFTPELIVGDLDSLRPEVRAYYEARGTSVERVEEQDTHDMEKALLAIEQRSNGSRYKVIALGAFGGRLDHQFANLNMLFKFRDRLDGLVLMSGRALAMLLAPGDNTVVRNAEVVAQACGLVPLGGPSGRVTTSGLQFDLHGQELEFGGLVSTSNAMTGDVAHVHTERPLLWTAELVREPRRAAGTAGEGVAAGVAPAGAAPATRGGSRRGAHDDEKQDSSPETRAQRAGAAAAAAAARQQQQQQQQEHDATDSQSGESDA